MTPSIVDEEKWPQKGSAENLGCLRPYNLTKGLGYINYMFLQPKRTPLTGYLQYLAKNNKQHTSPEPVYFDSGPPTINNTPHLNLFISILDLQNRNAHPIPLPCSHSPARLPRVFPTPSATSGSCSAGGVDKGPASRRRGSPCGLLVSRSLLVRLCFRFIFSIQKQKPNSYKDFGLKKQSSPETCRLSFRELHQATRPQLVDRAKQGRLNERAVDRSGAWFGLSRFAKRLC